MLRIFEAFHLVFYSLLYVELTLLSGYGFFRLFDGDSSSLHHFYLVKILFSFYLVISELSLLVRYHYGLYGET